MRIWVAALVLVVVVTAAITIKLLVRRRAPTEMRQTLALIDHGNATPCDERGVPRST